MSLKKKRIKKKKRNNILDVLKKSLSQADEANIKLLKEKIKLHDELVRKHKDNVKLEEAIRFLELKLKEARGTKELNKIKGRKDSVLIADELCDDMVGIGIKKSYEPSELVDPGDYVEIDEDGKIVKKIDGNQIVFKTGRGGKGFNVGVDLATESNSEFNNELLGVALLKEAARTVNQFGQVIENGKEIKIEELESSFKETKEKVTEQIRESFKSGKLIWGNTQFDVDDVEIDMGGSKKVSKENDPYELLNEDYLKDCVDVPAGENYKDGYMDRSGKFIKNMNIKT